MRIRQALIRGGILVAAGAAVLGLTVAPAQAQMDNRCADWQHRISQSNLQLNAARAFQNNFQIQADAFGLGSDWASQAAAQQEANRWGGLATIYENDVNAYDNMYNSSC